jgi:hypothetical protein
MQPSHSGHQARRLIDQIRAERLVMVAARPTNAGSVKVVIADSNLRESLVRQMFYDVKENVRKIRTGSVGLARARSR